MDLFDTDSILADEPGDLTVLHDREYRVRAYRRAADRIIIRGAVRDQKPPGLYLDDDPDPLTIHHMQVDLEVAFPNLEIRGVDVVFEMHPNETCPSIADQYGELVGVSIARGFTHRVRELFGGPRGCTHTTALLQAMAPVAVQCFWSMRAVAGREAVSQGRMPDPTSDQAWRMNIGSCHVWAGDGAYVAELEAGHDMEVPVFLRDRLDRLGLDAAAWTARISPERR